MPLLPVSSSGDGGGWGYGEVPVARRGMPVMLRRLTKFKSMDFELALQQLTYLVVAPRRVSKQAYYHKQTKNVWARDDMPANISPAMLILIAGFVSAAGLVWAFIYGLSWPATLLLIVKMVFRDLILFALLSALIHHQIANRLLLSSPTTGVRERVEFSYAFDVAVNAFWPLFITLYLGLLPLAALVVRRNWGALLLGNSLFLLALTQYIYVTYLGYSALPFVARAELFLAPLLPLVVGWVCSLLGLNVARWALEGYFARPWRY